MNKQGTVKKLRECIEEAMFMVSKGGDPKNIHALLVQALVLLEQMDRGAVFGINRDNDGGQEDSEIKKVARRLKLWARRPKQINARILKAFLYLEKKNGNVTEECLSQLFEPEDNFSSNFQQMKIIADRNHGKVFDVSGGQVSIWPPVSDYVREFQKLDMSRGSYE